MKRHECQWREFLGPNSQRHCSSELYEVFAVPFDVVIVLCGEHSAEGLGAFLSGVGPSVLREMFGA